MNASLKVCIALVVSTTMLLFPCAAQAHEDPTARATDVARNHLVAESMPAVYRIEVNGTVFDTKTGGEKKKQEIDFGLGTGFGVTKDGLVLTKMHVVNPGFEKVTGRIVAPNTFEYANGDSIKVVLLLTGSDGATYHAIVVGGNPNDAVDLALIKITDPVKSEYPFLVIADKRSGYDAVISIGTPLGFAFSVGEGIVSNPDLKIDDAHLLQTTALVLPGSSGGPIIRVRDHKVVGMSDSSYTAGQGAFVDLGFATPAPVLKAFLEKELRRLENTYP